MNLKICHVEGCESKILARDLCVKHYSRMRKNGSTDTPKSMITKKCKVESCKSPHWARGLCRKHDRRFQKYGSYEIPKKQELSPIEKLMSKVKKNSGERGQCWQYVGRIDFHGYGTIQINNKAVRAHRLSYELHKGKIKKGMHILHSCDYRACVNPDHLSEGTHQQNMDDMNEKGRAVDVKGSRCGSSKINEKQALDIYNAWHELGKSGPELAEKYGLKKSAIYGIAKGRTWSHVTGHEKMIRKDQKNVRKNNA